MSATAVTTLSGITPDALWTYPNTMSSLYAQVQNPTDKQKWIIETIFQGPLKLNKTDDQLIRDTLTQNREWKLHISITFNARIILRCNLLHLAAMCQNVMMTKILGEIEPNLVNSDASETGAVCSPIFMVVRYLRNVSPQLFETLLEMNPALETTEHESRLSTELVKSVRVVELGLLCKHITLPENRVLVRLMSLQIDFPFLMNTITVYKIIEEYCPFLQSQEVTQEASKQNLSQVLAISYDQLDVRASIHQKKWDTFRLLTEAGALLENMNITDILKNNHGAYTWLYEALGLKGSYRCLFMTYQEFLSYSENASREYVTGFNALMESNENLHPFILPFDAPLSLISSCRKKVMLIIYPDRSELPSDVCYELTVQVNALYEKLTEFHWFYTPGDVQLTEDNFLALQKSFLNDLINKTQLKSLCPSTTL